MYFTGNAYRDKWFYIEKEALSKMQRKRSVRTKKKNVLECMQIFPAGRPTSTYTFGWC